MASAEKCRLDPRKQPDETGLRLSFYLASGPEAARLREAARRYRKPVSWVAEQALAWAIPQMAMPSPDEYADLEEAAQQEAERRRQAAVKGMAKMNHSAGYRQGGGKWRSIKWYRCG